MTLKSLFLQNFRNYSSEVFRFKSGLTVIAGPNASGKSNLIEAIYLISTGRSFKADQDRQLINFGNTFCRVKGLVDDGDEGELEVVVSLLEQQFLKKKYSFNGVAKRRVDFAGKLVSVLFTPVDLDIVLGQPSSRRRFLDEVLEQVDLEYRVAHSIYLKALRQRNALLDQAQKRGVRNAKLFAYWDELLIRNGQIVTAKREGIINYINERDKELYNFVLEYDKSIVSEERFAQYKDAELGAGVTLVGPHRDELKIISIVTGARDAANVKFFSSRGQQRLVVLELKLAQIVYINEALGVKPLLLLDDIFSELDEGHIRHVFEATKVQQTIITTTHKEFVDRLSIKAGNVIEL
jgi:DNA replication and repair protein RecF